MIRQKTPYGCGMYAIANALDMPEFVTKDRLEKSITGNTIGQLTKWLQEDMCGYSVDVLYYSTFGKQLPEDGMFRSAEENEILPVMIEVQSENGKSHMVGARIDNKGFVTLFDSLRKKTITTRFKEINEMYDIVRGIFAFHYDDGRGWLILKTESNNEQEDKTANTR